VPGGKGASLPKVPRFLPRLLSGRDVQESRLAHFLSFSRRKKGHRPTPKLLCANAALIPARLAKQLISVHGESLPSLDPRMDRS
jgi:hypothetical protein